MLLIILQDKSSSTDRSTRAKDFLIDPQIGFEYQYFTLCPVFMNPFSKVTDAKL